MSSPDCVKLAVCGGSACYMRTYRPRLDATPSRFHPLLHVHCQKIHATYRNGVQMTDCFQATGEEWIWNLNGQYTTLTAQVGLDDTGDSSGSTTIVTFIGDGKTKQSVTLNPGNLPQTLNVSVSGVSNLLCLCGTAVGEASPIDFANAVLH